MKLSIIIPAFNEAKHIEACVRSARRALQTNARPELAAEIIVANNNSTDATADLARQAGAQVVFEPINQISRARNAGAKAAAGDWLLFIDADSVLSGETLADLLAAIERGGCAGGGCVVAMDRAPYLARYLIGGWNRLSRWRKWAAGSFVFCRADAFRDISGFSQELFAAEELDFSEKLKRWAKARKLRVVILTGHPHVSSGRKFYLYSKKELLCHSVRSLVFIRSTLRHRERLDFFYDGRR